MDQLHRYLFDELNVRGELVQLQASVKSVLDAQPYPLPLRQLLAEVMAATSLLAATLKIDGEISLQVQSEGAVKYAVINCTDQMHMRGVARWQGELDGMSFNQLLAKKAVMAITITPNQGERYQGLVALDQPTLAECLEQYFMQSEQLLTKVLLDANVAGDDPRVAGMLLQILPESSSGTGEEGLEHLWQLTRTITQDELLNESATTVLTRLYHQETVRVYEPQAVEFRCSCSRERSAAALSSIDKAELMEIIAEQGKISMNCQYCHALYEFDAVDIEAIHCGAVEGSSQLQ